MRSKNMGLAFRKMQPEDVDLIYRWANDPVVRSNGFQTEQIPYETHVNWFARVLADEAIYYFMLQDDGRDVGQLRLSVEDGIALISYSVSAENRGKGYGSRMLKLVEQQIATGDITGIRMLKGLVKYTNPASEKVFEKCGYVRCEFPEYIEFTKKIDR